MDQKQLYLDLNQAFNDLFRIRSAVSAESYNQPAAEGKWSAGQLADHLRLSAAGLLQLVNGPVEHRNAPIDEKVAVIRHFMLDFSQKFKSPENVVPRTGWFDRELQSEELNNLQLGWLEAVRLLDPAPTCLLFPAPAVGFLTRQESGYFILFHLQRHLQQMKSA